MIIIEELWILDKQQIRQSWRQDKHKNLGYCKKCDINMQETAVRKYHIKYEFLQNFVARLLAKKLVCGRLQITSFRLPNLAVMQPL